MGAGTEPIRDRRNIYEDCKADAAMHVRAAELGSLPEIAGSSHAGGNARRRQFVSADHFLVPRRGTHLTARTMPPAVILAPETSLIWPAGHHPSSTRIRRPSRKSTTPCPRATPPPLPPVPPPH